MSSTTPSQGAGITAASYHSRRLTSNTLIMMVGLLGSRIAGFIRERVIAHQFGQQYYTDIYNGSFTIPDLIFFLIAGGAISSAFIPVFSEYIHTGREREAWRIFSVVLFVMTVFIGALIVLGEIFAPTLVLITNPGFAHIPHKVEDTVRLTRILLPAQLCFFLGGLMMGTLTARNIFSGQILGPILYNVGIIFGGLFLTKHYGVAGLCWGAVGGAFFGNFVLQWIFVRATGGYLVTKNLLKHLRHPGVVQVFKLMLPVILGLALPQVSTIIGKMFASDLGNGAQSALMNANKLMHVPIALFGQAAGIAIFPVMAAQAARKEMAALRASVNFGLRAILFMSVPASILLYVLALPIIQFLLQTGKYSYEDALIAAAVLRCFAIGTFAWCAISVAARGFYAVQDTKTPVVIGTLVTFVLVGLNLAFFKLADRHDQTHAVANIALTISITAILDMLALVYMLRIKLHGIYGGRLMQSVLRTVLAAGVAGIVCWVLRNALQWFFMQRQRQALAINPGYRPHVTFEAFVIITACLALSTTVYLAMALWLRMEEVNVLRRLFRRRAIASPN